MTTSLQARRWPVRVPLVLAAFLAGAVFVVDTITNLEIAVAVFYVIVVLICARVLERRGLLVVAGSCMALTILSHFLTRSGAPEAGLINCGISLTAIAATTYLALRLRAAQSAAHETRAQLLHMARVSALGELTASIAHEINQPLAGLSAHGAAMLRWLDSEPPNLPEARASSQRIVDDAKRASAIIQRVRSLARKSPTPHAYTNVNEAIRETASLVSGELQRHHITLRTDLDPELPLVIADRVQLEQVLLNLALNAIDAMSLDGGGELLFSAVMENDDVRVSVADTGPGVNSESLDRLFEPFYSSKAEGTGLGLTICRSIVEAHGGRIWATANAPRGLMVHFMLPMEREESA